MMRVTSSATDWSYHEVAASMGLPPFHAEKVRRTRHVDIEKGPAHQEVRRLGGDVLGELCQPLRRDDTRQPALAAPAHQVGHGAQRQFSRLIRDFTRDGGRK